MRGEARPYCGPDFTPARTIPSATAGLPYGRLYFGRRSTQTLTSPLFRAKTKSGTEGCVPFTCRFVLDLTTSKRETPLQNCPDDTPRHEEAIGEYFKTADPRVEFVDSFVKPLVGPSQMVGELALFRLWHEKSTLRRLVKIRRDLS